MLLTRSAPEHGLWIACVAGDFVRKRAPMGGKSSRGMRQDEPALLHVCASKQNRQLPQSNDQRAEFFWRTKRKTRRNKLLGVTEQSAKLTQFFDMLHAKTLYTVIKPQDKNPNTKCKVPSTQASSYSSTLLNSLAEALMNRHHLHNISVQLDPVLDPPKCLSPLHVAVQSFETGLSEFLSKHRHTRLLVNRDIRSMRCWNCSRGHMLYPWKNFLFGSTLDDSSTEDWQFSIAQC